MTEEPTLRPLSGRPVEPLPSGRWPGRPVLEGRHARLEPLDPARHASALFEAGHAAPATTDLWTYMPYGPFADEAAFAAWARASAGQADPIFYAVLARGAAGAAVPRGVASFLNIVPRNGSIEIGHIWFAPSLQRTRAATEALYLLMRETFEGLGYRRLEWKCNALNEASRAAARRLGFTYEGVFHNHMIVKGLNRDTAWYSILAEEWPAIRAAFEAWLEPGNFDAEGRQRAPLRARREERDG